MAFLNSYQGKRVFVTGHTGFKGAWLCEWLLSLGAEVFGFALEPPTDPSLFDQLNLSQRMHHKIGNVCDLTDLSDAVANADPDFVFHLAAQPLVIPSYRMPVETYATNVMGTVNLLESVRLRSKACSVICITTDKCYENKEWIHSYREEDPMGGYDPYSSSKGAAELVIAAYRRSFFNNEDLRIGLASARAGNVIGGGDWAQNRIVPDCIRACREGASIPVRNRKATRPWQHVLEPLSGYLWLGVALQSSYTQHFPYPLSLYRSGFNFGPALSSNRTVEELVIELLKHTDGQWEDKSDPNKPHEASLLNLSIDKAHHLLEWTPVWDFATTIKHTVNWYIDVDAGNSALRLTQKRIKQYTSDASQAGVVWAKAS